jgi:diguanylate cyclase (GGDEF)-like protein/PAS domain S-box-containing protein
VAGFCALAADAVDSAASASGGAHAGLETLGMLLPTIAFVALGAGALHPSMRLLTVRATEPAARLSSRRLVLLTVAVLVPPATLLVTSGRGDDLATPVVVAAWAGLSVLVMLRLAGLVRSRERVANYERVLNDTGAALVVATNRAEISRAALDGALNLLGPDAVHVRASLVEADREGWVVTSSVGHRAHRAVGRRIAPAHLGFTLGTAAGRPPEARVGTAPIDAPGDEAVWTVGSPLVSQNALRGALVVTAASAPPPGTVDALTKLAGHAALALETASVVADLHRQRSERRFGALVRNASDIVLVVGDDGGVEFTSPAVIGLLGVPEGQVEGRHLGDHVHPDDAERLSSMLHRARTANGTVGPGEVRLRHADGGWRWFDAVVTDMSSEPLVGGTVVNMREVTERKLAEQRLAANEARFRSLVQHSSDVVAVLDDRGRVTYASPSSSEVLGYRPDELVDRGVEVLIHPDDWSAFEHALDRVDAESDLHRIEVRIRTWPQAWKTFEVTIRDLRGEPSVGGIVLNAHDVTERKALESSLRHQAHHDELTGLANRVLFRQRISEALNDGPATRQLAVLFIDLDDFKTVNDSLGHDAGDDLLMIIGSRVEAALRPGDTAARLGGDEFAVLLDDIPNPEHATGVARRLLGIVREPVTLGDREIVVTASVGIAFGGVAQATSPTILLRSADAAMYHAKSAGKGRVKVFDESMHLSAFERLEFKGDLARGVERNEFVLHFQPIIDLASGRITGLEALVRWDHPARGLVGPGSFVPLAEETGLIVPLGRWVLNEALDWLRHWQRLADPELTMSINLSVLQLADERIVDDLAAALDRTGVDPAAVVVELTEGLLAEEGLVSRRLEHIRQLGVGVAADDFGTGFASYAALQRMPFTTVKIDRGLIDGLGTSFNDRAVAQVGSIIEMAHGTGLTVVAEGIESSAQLTALTHMGCDLGQGYHFGRPLPPDDVERRLVGEAGRRIA